MKAVADRGDWVCTLMLQYLFYTPPLTVWHYSKVTVTIRQLSVQGHQKGEDAGELIWGKLTSL